MNKILITAIVLAGLAHDAGATNRTPLVLIGGTVTPIASTDMLSVPGGISTGALTATGVVALGAVNIQGALNGPFIANITIPSTAYAFGEMFVYNIDGVVPAFPADLFATVIHVSATADTTTHTQHAGAAAFEVTGSRSAGANDMTNTALELIASGAQVNEAIRVLAGDTVISAGNVSIDGAGANLFQTSSTGFIATLGTMFAEGAGNAAIDITAGPTNSIQIRNVAGVIGLNNASASALTITNNGGGAFTALKLSGAATAATTVWLSPNAPASVNHGSFGTGSTNMAGNVTGIGSFTSVVLTFSSAFPNRSWCTATPNGSGLLQIITVANSASAPTFSCFLGSTGIASNCVDFTYTCQGQ